MSRRPGLVLLASGLFLLLLLALAFGTRSPRGQMNVLQGTAAVFFSAVAARQLRGATPLPAPRWRGDSRGELWLALGAGAAVYAVTLSLSFISDDFAHLATARQPALETFLEQLTRGQAGTFLRPIPFLSYSLEYRLWGEAAAGYHLTNLLLHLAAIAGVFYLCREVERGTELAGTAALVFALLPASAEAVAWMGARFDLLASAFLLWALLLYVRFRMRGGSAAYAAALLLALLAVLSKESAYVAPVLAAALEVFLLPGRRWKPLLGFWTVAGAAFAYRWAVLGGIGGYPAGAEPAAFQVGLKTFAGLLLRGPGQLLFGVNWLQPPGLVPMVAGALAAAALLALALLVQVPPARRGWVGFSLVWILVSLAPAHPLLLIGAGLTNSRVLYLAGAGAALLVAALLGSVEPVGLRRGWTLGLAAVLALGLWHNLGAWRWTSARTEQVLGEVRRLEPAPPPKAEFVFEGLPTSERGVFFLAVGLSEAVQLTYGRDDLRARRADQAPPAGVEPRPEIRLRWRGEPERLLEPRTCGERSRTMNTDDH